METTNGENITIFYEVHKIARGRNRQIIINSLQKYDNQSAEQCVLPAGDDCKCSWFDANKNNNTQQSTGEDNQVAMAEVCNLHLEWVQHQEELCPLQVV